MQEYSSKSRRVSNMARLSETKLSSWEASRDLNAELLQALHEVRRGEWARKIEFTPQADGSVRRVVTRHDGTVEKDEMIPSEKLRSPLPVRQPVFPRRLLPNYSAFPCEHYRIGNKEEEYRQARPRHCSKWLPVIRRFCKSWRRKRRFCTPPGKITTRWPVQKTDGPRRRG